MARKTKRELIDEEIEKHRPAVARPERPKGLKIVSGTGYHKFDEKPVYEGYFVDKVLAEKDEPRFKTKKGDVIGFKFVNKDGETTKLPNSDAINRALEGDKFNKKTFWWIEFVEKRQLGTGRNKRSWNEFVIGIQNSK